MAYAFENEQFHSVLDELQLTRGESQRVSDMPVFNRLRWSFDCAAGQRRSEAERHRVKTFCAALLPPNFMSYRIYGTNSIKFCTSRPEFLKIVATPGRILLSFPSKSST